MIVIIKSLIYELYIDYIFKMGYIKSYNLIKIYKPLINDRFTLVISNTNYNNTRKLKTRVYQNYTDYMYDYIHM
jgi:hypothetical protein